jgi:hypothetical protein
MVSAGGAAGEEVRRRSYPFQPSSGPEEPFAILPTIICGGQWLG